MATPRKAKVTEAEPGSVDELTRVIALALRYQGMPQGVLVHDFSDAGIPVGRVATLLNTTPNTVSQQKRAKRPQWPKKEV
jgi:hypothetical protein